MDAVMIDEQTPTDAELLDRFVTETDARAFAVLVERHGPMVFAVCRRFLPDTHDAEDAFQATFLILVRRAGRLRQPELLANWLYGVAQRVALRARAVAARRRQREDPSADLAQAQARAAPQPNHDLGPLVHEEVDRLPARYRGPVVLCYLQGKSNEEAARELACPVGTVKSRLSRARDLLRGRLERRGVTLSVGALTATLTAEAVGLPAALAGTTARTAVQFAANAAAGGLVSAPVAALTQGVLRAMMWTKVKLLGVALAACLLVVGASWFALAGREQDGKAKADAKLFQGKWKAVKVGGGTAVRIVEAIWGHEIEVTADRIIVKAGDKTRMELEYKLNPAAKPKEIDLKVVKDLPPGGNAPGKPVPAGTAIKGIYALEQDKVTIVWTHEENTPRPTELTVQQGMSYFSQEWRRLK
ncbi:MAG: sigma-70 family RNA polymerase sigma factor [Gemmataceae bacterium]|nr:sigma-70 family RNA polymerase sigma factor [Gemmataceae bacterium]